jgi:glucan phosphoethanolaminetransferase (alkaline phosphatase superfamily)
MMDAIGSDRLRKPWTFVGLFLFSAVFLAPAWMLLFVPAAPIGDRLEAVAYSVVLWVAWIAIWRSGYRACVAATPFLLLVPPAAHVLLSYHSLLTPAVLGIIAETNSEESAQFLRGLWLPIALAYGVVLASAAAAVWLLHGNDVVWRHRSRVWVLGVVGLVFGSMHLLDMHFQAAARDLRAPDNPFRSTPLPQVLENIRPSFPFGVFVQLADYLDAQRKIASAHAALAQFRFGARQKSDLTEGQLYVLVIGESSRRDRWSLYGYPRATNPLLQQESHLVTYSNVVSAATATRISVPVILTRKPGALALQPLFPERSLVSAFHEAGFATRWLSMQAPVGIFDSPIAMYAREADQATYYNRSGGFGLTPPDGVMLEPLKQGLAAQSNSRALVVIHTLGSHFDYRYRYPPAFEKFKPSPTRDEQVSLHDPGSRDKVNNSYDNSILYTDYFLSQVIAAIKASGRPIAAMLYVSDHGEDVFDPQCGLVAGHGRATPVVYQVPFLFWYSDEYAQRFPDKIAALRAHRDQAITTEAVFPLLLDAADIHFPGEDPTRSPMSPSFAPHPRIVVNFRTSVDFDHAHMGKNCELVN